MGSTTYFERNGRQWENVARVSGVVKVEVEEERNKFTNTKVFKNRPVTF